jgi:TP901 family phage tail tape measure protein
MAKNNNDFRILITAQLDEKASEKTLRDQLQSLQDKLNIKIGIDPKLINQLKKDISRKELDLSVGIDDQSIQTVKSQVKNLQRSISKNTKIELFEFDDSELRQKFDSINEAYKAVQKTFNGQKPRVTQFVNVDDDTEKIKKFTLQVEEADKAIHKLQFALDENGSYFLKSRELVDRQAESLEKLRKEEERLAEQIAKKRESANTKRRQEELKLLENQQKAIQKNIEREQQLREKAIEEESKIRLAIAKKNEELERSLELYRKQAEIRVKDLERRYGDKIDRTSVDNYLNAVNALSAQTPNIRHQMKALDLEFRNLSASIKESGSHTKSFGQQLAIAMQRIPIWVLGMTAFYQPLHLMQDAIAQIIEIDTQLTTLERVTGNQTNVNELLEESIRLADQLGNKVSQINEGLIEFARQGFEGDALIKIAEFATLMSNVSDLTVEESASSLTAAINAFSLEAENAIRVVDALNEVDNNFAISTQDLSQVIQKAAGTANTFNVSLEAMIGHATAIGQVTRESGNIIGTSLKSIYSRITTMDESVRLLESVGVAVRDINGELRPVEDILKDLSQRWSSLNSEQQQSIGLQVAGRYQLSRFLVLMQQFDEALKAQETALNSSGSAYRENEKFLESYQARLNRLSNAWTEAALSMQEAFLGDGILLFAESMTSLTKNFSEFIKTVGLVPPIMGAVGAGFLLFNSQLRAATMTNGVLMIKSLKGLITGFRTLDGALAAATLKTRAFAVASSTATVAVNGLKTAVMATGRFLAGAALPIAGFMAIGWAIDKLIEKIVEHNEQQRKLKQENEKIIDSYINQKTEIDSLLSRFNALNSIKDRTNEQEQEYLDVQNKLGQLMPNLISHIDEYGQTHIKVGDALENELQYAKELVEVYRTDLANAYKERFEEALKAQADAQKEADRIQNQLNRTGQHGGILGDVSILSDAQRRGLEFQLRAFQRDVANANEEIRRQVGEMITEILKLNNVEIDDNLSNQIQEFVKSFDVSDLNADEIAQKAQHFSDSLANLQEQMKSGNEEAIKDAKEELISFAASMGMTDEKAQEFIGTLFEQAEAQDLVNQVTAEGAEEQESLAEKYNNAISAIQSLNGVLNELNEGHGLSGDKIGFLLENYPHLLSYLGDETALREAIQQEIANEEKIAKQVILAKLSYQEQFYNNVIKANAQFVNEFKDKYGIDLRNFKNLAQAKLAVDNKLRQEMTKAWNAYFRSVDERLRKQEIAYPEVDLKYRALKFKEQQYVKAQNTFEGIFMDSITATVGTSIGSFGSKKPSVSKSKSSGGGRKSSSSSDRENIYVADKFKQALEKLNLEIEKQQKLREKYPEYATEYRNSLEKEIDLENKRKKLLQERYKELQKQIKLGKIQQTGVFDPNKEFDSAKALEEIDKAKSELLDLQQEILKSENMIAELETQFAFSTLEVFNEQREDLTQVYQNGENRLKLLSKTSEEYRKELEKQMDVLKRKQQINEKEMRYIKELIASGKLNVKTVEELTDRLHELGLETYSLFFQQQELLYELVVESLQKQKNTYLEGLRKESEEIVENLEKQIENTENYYDQLIEAQKERLELLDEEYEKEDRLQRLREIDEEIEKVKNDKRFSYITADGQEILTYDKAKVSELEKERNELLKQYQREDIKKAIQDEIDRLEKAKNNKTDILRKEVEETKRKYDELIEQEEMKWNELIEAAQNGTLTFDELMNGWYGSSLKTLKQYGIDVQTEVNKIKKAFGSLGQIQIPEATQLPSTNNQNNNHKLVPYHDGGIVGGAKSKLQKLANVLFNDKLKPNETIVKSLVGELQIPPHNIPNIVHNIGSIVSSMIPKAQQPVIQKHYNFHNMQVKANNMQEFLRSIDFVINSNQS